MSDENLENLVLRVERLEKLLVGRFAALTLAGAGFCVLAIYISDCSELIAADFGAKLPNLTRFVIEMRTLWLVLAVALPVASMLVAWKSKTEFSFRFSNIAGWVLFATGGLIIYASYLPFLRF